MERAQAPRQPTRPSKPTPPPPPLSKEAISGNVPLRTFGQLKQLWQARASGEPEPGTDEMPAPEGSAAPDEPAPAVDEATNQAEPQPEAQPATESSGG
jgi:uncharacterized protein